MSNRHSSCSIDKTRARVVYITVMFYMLNILCIYVYINSDRSLHVSLSFSSPLELVQHAQGYTCSIAMSTISAHTLAHNHHTRSNASHTPLCTCTQRVTIGMQRTHTHIQMLTLIHARSHARNPKMGDGSTDEGIRYRSLSFSRLTARTVVVTLRACDARRSQRSCRVACVQQRCRRSGHRYTYTHTHAPPPNRFRRRRRRICAAASPLEHMHPFTLPKSVERTSHAPHPHTHTHTSRPSTKVPRNRYPCAPEISKSVVDTHTHTVCAGQSSRSDVVRCSPTHSLSAPCSRNSNSAYIHPQHNG